MSEPIEARCPFCDALEGLVTQLAEHDEEGDKLFAVVCRKCGAQGPHENSAQYAISAWAERVGESDDDDEADDDELDPELAAALEQAIAKRVHSMLKRRRG